MALYGLQVFSGPDHCIVSESCSFGVPYRFPGLCRIESQVGGPRTPYFWISGPFFYEEDSMGGLFVAVYAIWRSYPLFLVGIGLSGKNY